MAAESIHLKPLSDADAAAIRQWPPYPPWVAELDYALRADGWLGQFPASSTNRRFAAWQGKSLVGFSLLVDINNGNAEFYIALHPGRLGGGIGRTVTQQTVAVGFGELGLRRIHLKVRDWHYRAIHLYESVGFRQCGMEVVEFQGKPVDFVQMEILREGEGGAIPIREESTKQIHS